MELAINVLLANSTFICGILYTNILTLAKISLNLDVPHILFYAFIFVLIIAFIYFTINISREIKQLLETQAKLTFMEYTFYTLENLIDYKQKLIEHEFETCPDIPMSLMLKALRCRKSRNHIGYPYYAKSNYYLMQKKSEAISQYRSKQYTQSAMNRRLRNCPYRKSTCFRRK